MERQRRRTNRLLIQVPAEKCKLVSVRSHNLILTNHNSVHSRSPVIPLLTSFFFRSYFSTSPPHFSSGLSKFVLYLPCFTDISWHAVHYNSYKIHRNTFLKLNIPDSTPFITFTVGCHASELLKDHFECESFCCWCGEKVPELTE